MGQYFSDIGQHRTMIFSLREKKQTKQSLQLYQLIAQRSFQIIFQGGGTHIEYNNLSELKRQRLDFEEAKAAKICGTKVPQGGNCTEKALKLCRKVSCSYLWLRTSLCMHERKLCKGEKTPEKSVQKNCQSSHRARSRSFFHQPE